MKASDIAYNKIRKMIMTTELKPGQEIHVPTLIENLELGKTPIREALNRLSYEGYIKILPRKGMLVSNLDVDDLEKLKDLRLHFVEFISQQIIQNSGNDEIKMIRAKQEKLKETENTFMNCLMADVEFHETTYELCNNKFAEAMLKRNLYLSIRLMVMKKDLGVTLQTTIDDFEGLIRCIEDQDQPGLYQLLMEHIAD